MSPFAERQFRLAPIVLAVLIAGRAHAAAPVYLTTPFGASQTLSYFSDGRAFRTSVPITVGDVPLDKLDVRISDVAIGSQHDPELRTCFTVTKVPPAQTTTAIELRTIVPERCTARLHPGVYLVTLAIEPLVKPAVPMAPQLLPLQLTLVAPELRPLGTQTIDQLYCWPTSAPTVSPSTLRLFNISRNAPLGPVTVKQADPAKVDDHEVSATLSFEGSHVVGAAAQEEIPITLSGSFPKGKTKTMVSIDAPQLATPIFVAFEVISRFHPWLVVPAIVLGLLLGFLMRVVLAQAISRNGARVAAFDVLAKIRAAEDQSEDDDFRQATVPLRAVLEAAIKDKKNAAALPAAAKNAESKLAAALAALNTRIAAVMNDLDALSRQLKPSAHYPQAIVTALANANAELNKALKYLHAGNASASRQELDTARQAITDRVDKAATEWRNTLRISLNALGALTPIPAPYATLLTNEVAAIRGQLDIIPAGQQPPAELATLLAAVANTRYAVETRISLQILAELAGYAAEKIVKPFEKKGKDATAITTAAQGLRDALAADRSATLTAPVQGLANLLRVMEQTILDLAKPEQRVKLQEKIAEGQWVVAAAASASGEGPALGGAGEAAADAAPATAAPLSATEAVVRIVAAPAVMTQAQIATQRRMSWIELLISKAMQSAVATIGIVIVGSLALIPTFDGTWRGLALAFFWGYAGDLTADAFTDAAKKLR